MIALPWHVCVLIPARNEEVLLPRCLTSVLNSLALLPPTVTSDIVVAVDSSTDRTQQIAESMLSGYGTVVATEVGKVGGARALAARVALGRFHGAERHCWMANTDADSVVPPAWLNEQLLYAERNFEAIAGTIDVKDFDEHDPVVQDRFRSTYLIWPNGSHPHVHGANLGVRADAYLNAGGWNDLRTAEDHDLWNRLVELGVRRCSTNQIRVVTSGRRVGRAPNGFADALAAHNDTAA